MVSRTTASGRLPIGQLAFATRTRQNRNRPPFRLPPSRAGKLEGMAGARARSLARSLARLKKNFNGHRIPDALLKVISHSPKGQGTRRSVVPFSSPSSRLFLRFRAPSRTILPSFSRISLFSESYRARVRESERASERERDWKSAWLEFSR